MNMSPFEIVMLLCFGFAWPVSIAKSWRSKSTKGKSLGFLFVIEIGYIAGVIHKFFFNMDPVIALYSLNFLMVFADILLFFRNRKIEAAALP
ncbi:MAG: hypothetical protein ACLFRY_01970 [Spirochaetia bacterium]